MAKVTPITEHFQHFLAELKESFWGDLYGETKQAWKKFFESDSARARDRMVARESYERQEKHGKQPYRNGFYERDFVTRFGTIRLRIARTRDRSFLRLRTFSATSRRSGAADSGSFLAWH